MNELVLFILWAFDTFDFGGCRGAESFWCKSFLVGCVSTGGVIIVIIIRLATFPDCHHHHLISPISTCVTLWWPSSWSSSSQYAVHNVYTLCSVLDIPGKYVLHWWPSDISSSATEEVQESCDQTQWASWGSGTACKVISSNHHHYHC